MAGVPAGAVDGHAHVFHRSLPTASRPRYLPGYDATPDAYLRLLDAHGIAGAVLVQPSFLGSHNDFLLDCLAGWPHRFRGVLVLGTHRPISRRLLAVDGVAGIRLNLVGQGPPDLRAREWRDLGRDLARHGQHLEVQAVGAQWTALAPDLRSWPSAIVIDHLGLPGAAPESDRAVLDLARHPHVWVKISAPYRSPTGAAATMLDLLLHESGADRLLWGSDWPWTRHESHTHYSDSLDWLRTHLDPDTFRRTLADNPTHLLNWSPTSPGKHQPRRSPIRLDGRL